jgi:dihydropteroate synthase
VVTKLVGILNITPDSFSDGGKFDSLSSALNHLNKMLEDGADAIDIGAESTRPNSTPISTEEEWSRLEKILPAIISAVKKYPKKIQTSIDSYHFKTIKKAHDLGVDVINDVRGLADERIVDFIAKKNITTILMHCAPPKINPDLVINPHINLIPEMLSWANQKISDLEKKGVKKSQLIFDVGIGFNKNAQQSIRVLKNLDAFKILGLPLYVGHSKKSFLDAVNIEGDRAEKTLVISKFLAEKKIEFLRVHDVKNNKLAVTKMN